MEKFRYKPLYTASEIKKIELAAIQSDKSTGFSLMGRAARIAFEVLSESWPSEKKVQIFCGVGNNGGDGYLLAALALTRGWQVIVWQVGDVARVSGDAALARKQALKEGITEDLYRIGAVHQDGGVIVDAMIGTGLRKKLKSSYQAAVLDINKSGLPILAIDLPTGLNSDTGEIIGEAVKADRTITYIGKKRGALTALGPDFVGELTVETLGLNVSDYEELVRPKCFELDLEELLSHLHPRKLECHKGTFGSVLIVGGNISMGGAVILAGEAAMRTGAGVVRIFTRREHTSGILARVPELIVQDSELVKELESLISESDIVLVGPGLGSDSWAKDLLASVMQSDAKVILDADALNLIEEKRSIDIRMRSSVITPHPGEAARLLGCSSAEIQRNRFQATEILQKRFGGIVVLKGNGTLIYNGEYFLLCSYGNPGMATAGMGDVLGGVIASFLAQGLDASFACSLAVCLHAVAADKSSHHGTRGMLASDLMLPMRELLG